MDEITLRLIHNLNEQWKTGKIPERLKEEIIRDKYHEILKYLNDRQIISITGLRRTGKTTIMVQLIDHLIKNKINPDNILYFSFDEITSKNPEIIEEIIEYFFSTISKKDLKTEEKHYIFFDEIQKIDNWQAIIKRYYDQKYKIKFIVSGSESLFILKKTKESLAGRNYEFTLNPLRFKEFLDFKNIKINNKNYNLLYKELMPDKQKIKILFEDFLLRGGFPEIVNLEINKAQEYISNTVINKIVFKDIPSIFKLSNPDILLKILEIISQNSSQLFELDNLTSFLNISRNTASTYLSYLENSFLIKLSYNFTKSKIKQLRTSKKAYVSDNGIINTLLKQNTLPLTEEIGNLAETQIYNEIKNNNKYFWRDKYKHEIDIIIKNKDILPIEVKFKNNLKGSDLDNIKFFLNKNKVNKAIIITKDAFKKEEDINFIPAWLFLLGDIKSLSE